LAISFLCYAPCSRTIRQINRRPVENAFKSTRADFSPARWPLGEAFAPPPIYAEKGLTQGSGVPDSYL